MSTELPMEPEAAEDFRATANAFSHLSGVLGGFCFTVLVLVLSPDFLSGSTHLKDWVLGLLLIAAFFYVLSASFLANSTNSFLMKRVKTRRRVFDAGVLLQNAAHVILSATLTIVVYQYSSTVGMVAAVVILLLTLLNGILNLGIEFRSMKIKR